MNFQKIVLPVIGIILVALGWRLHGWGGVALVVGAIVMWILMQYTRIIKVLQGAAQRPVGYCDSAVTVDSRLKKGWNLLKVVGLARALGEQLSAKDAQPEVYRWTDPSAASVTCEFVGGKLVKWELLRPEATPEQGSQPTP